MLLMLNDSDSSLVAVLTLTAVRCCMNSNTETSVYLKRHLYPELTMFLLLLLPINQTSVFSSVTVNYQNKKQGIVPASIHMRTACSCQVISSCQCVHTQATVTKGPRIDYTWSQKVVQVASFLYRFQAGHLTY